LNLSEIVMAKNTLEDSSKKVRLDKWLWAARFFKTRSLSQDAISGNKIRLNGQTVKPAKEVRIGDELTIRTGFVERTVKVQTLSLQRRSAAEAALLYEETLESIEQRQKASELHRQEAGLRSSGSGRPTKKNRRQIHRFIGKS